MSTAWISVTRVLIPLEGVAGMMINGLLIFHLTLANIGQSAKLYYYSCVISATLSFYTAFLVMVTVDAVLIVDEALGGVFYGPLLFFFPPWVADYVAMSFFAQIHTLWQAIPAPSILQWLSLSRRDMSSVTKLMLAYAIPLAFYIHGWRYMPYLVPDEILRSKVAASVERIHGTNATEFHVFAVRVSDKISFHDKGFDAVDLAVYDIVPSFAASYALFAVAAVRIREALRSFGSTASTRTAMMQQRFFRAQIAQMLLPPPVLSSVPMGAMCGASVLGREGITLSFFFSLMPWPMPAFSALLLLGFVRKTTLYSTPKLSLTKISIHVDKSSSRT